MDLPDRGWKAVCSHVRRIQGVTGFLGSMSGAKPQPISAEEARAILQKAGEIRSEKVIRSRQTFSVGEAVRIIDGPFDTFTGSIEEVNMKKPGLKVMVAFLAGRLRLKFPLPR